METYEEERTRAERTQQEMLHLEGGEGLHSPGRHDQSGRSLVVFGIPDPMLYVVVYSNTCDAFKGEVYRSHLFSRPQQE